MPAVLTNDGAELRANGTVPTLTWIGHSTFLVQIDSVNILTDPHWGDRAQSGHVHRTAASRAAGHALRRSAADPRV